MGLKGLNQQIKEIEKYVGQVLEGTLPMNHQIIYNLQDIFNMLPDITPPKFVDAFHVKTNDQMLVVYLAAMIRSIIALHNLINNKITNRDAEKKEINKKSDEKPQEEKKTEIKVK